MSLIRKLAGETAIYGLSSILSRLLNYVVLTPFLTRVFLKGEYGVVSILYTYSAILMVLFTYRMETGFFRFGSREDGVPKTFGTAATSILVTTIAFVALIQGLRPQLADWLNFSDTPQYITLITVVIALDALAAIPFARLRLTNQPIRFAVLKTGQILVNIFFVYFFLKGLPWLAEQGVWAEYWQDTAEQKIGFVFWANLLASAVVLLFLSPQFLRIKGYFSWPLLKRMLIYAGPLIIVGLAAVVNQLIAYPLLENLLPGTLEENRDQTGIYSAAAKLAVLMNLFIQAFNYAAEPFFFNHSARDDARGVYAQVGQVFAMVGSVAFVGIVVYLDVIKYFIGADLRGGLGVVPILLLAYFFLGWYYNFSIWYKLTDQTRFGDYISLGGMAVTLVLNFLLVPIPGVGYYGAAIAALACYGFMAGASYWFGRKYYPIAYPMPKMLGYILLALVVYALHSAGGKYIPGLDNLWLGIVWSTLWFGGFLFALWRWERSFLLEVLRRTPTE